MKNFILFFLVLQNVIFAKDIINKYSEAIEDNSFIIEEAYNQEDRVVQHIFNLFYERKSKTFLTTFTQEWPLFSQKNQLSFTLPYYSINNGEYSGISDLMINYRYQLTGHDDFITLAPRLSLILPTGNKANGLGNDAYGLEFNIPASKRISEFFVTHYNAGARIFPSYKLNDKNEFLSSYFIGASIIYLPTYNLNIMLEALTAFDDEINELNQLEKQQNTILNFGLRYAIDINNLQIVPGISLPIVITKNNSPEYNMFFYLSFEHSF